MYGAAVVQLVTDIAKYSVGRLRPNFIDVCQPDLSMFNCSDGYITADVCTGIPSLVRHGRYLLAVMKCFHFVLQMFDVCMVTFTLNRNHLCGLVVMCLPTCCCLCEVVN